jgi:hypothetical protein
MATLSVQDAPVSGLADVQFDAADVGGDEVATGAGVVLLVSNGSGSTRTVTVETPGTVRGLSVEDPDVVVPAGATAAIPMVRAVFGALAQITYDDETSVEVAAVKVAR